jgi:hypothetical protein
MSSVTGVVGCEPGQEIAEALFELGRTHRGVDRRTKGAGTLVASALALAVQLQARDLERRGVVDFDGDYCAGA